MASGRNIFTTRPFEIYIELVGVYVPSKRQLYFPSDLLTASSFYTLAGNDGAYDGLQGIARLFMETSTVSVLAAALCASPAFQIMNMGNFCKPDINPWLLQLIMIEYFFRHLISTGAGEDRKLVKGSGRKSNALILSAEHIFCLSR